MKPRVLISRAVFNEVVERIAEHCDVEANNEDVVFSPSELRERMRGKEGALVTPSERIDASLLAESDRLKIVSNMAVGYDNFDLDAMTQKGVIGTNTPDVLNETTADFGWALMMAAARRITEAEAWLRGGNWAKWSYDMLLGQDIGGTTLGIVGMGRIGQAIARRAKGFQMKVLYHNRARLSRESEEELCAQFRSKTEILRESDHLILTLPHTPATHHFVGAAELEQMRHGATLVNVARGGIVDENALVHALRAGQIGAAALDVFEGEPTVRSELLAIQNVVLTPHIGSASLRTRRAMADLAADNLLSGLSIKGYQVNPRHVLNADVIRKAAAT